MLKIDIGHIGESQWREYQPGVRVLIRPLSASKRSELERKATYRKNGVDRIDAEKLENLLRDHIVEDWEGIVGADDQPIPATPENVKLILDHLHGLRQFCMNQAVTLYEEAEADAEKNGSAS
jgi:hypothetical protein